MARAALAGQVEAMPEADRLDGFPHPRETSRVYGHASAEEAFGAALEAGKLHHAWLIVGPAGIGKATLAYRFASAALARDGDRDMFGGPLAIDREAAAVRQVLSLSHPGLLLIRRPYDAKGKRFAATIPVDEVRRLKSFLALSAEAGGRRVVIVDSADELNANAANALLKSLEEPPARSVFLIVSSAPGRLLPTIRSRCRTLVLQPLNEGDLQGAVGQALDASGKARPGGAAWESLVRLSAGSARKALALIDGGGLELQSRIDALFAALPAINGRLAHQLGDQLQAASEEQKFNLFLDLFEATLARLIRAAATGSGHRDDVALAQRLIGVERLATFAGLWETLARDRAEAASLNLDRKALILKALSRLEVASRT